MKTPAVLHYGRKQRGLRRFEPLQRRVKKRLEPRVRSLQRQFQQLEAPAALQRRFRHREPEPPPGPLERGIERLEPTVSAVQRRLERLEPTVARWRRAAAARRRAGAARRTRRSGSHSWLAGHRR